MFHEALLTSEQPGWSIARGVPLRALLGAAAAGACIGWTIAVLPAASAGLYAPCKRHTHIRLWPSADFIVQRVRTAQVQAFLTRAVAR